MNSLNFHLETVIWLCLQLLNLAYSNKIQQLDSTKSLYIWEMFKLRNVYLYAEINSGSGSLFTVTNSENDQPLVDVSYKRNQQIIITLPMENNWRKRFVIPIPHYENNRTQLIFVLSNEEATLYFNCEKIMKDDAQQISFLYNNQVRLDMAGKFDGDLAELKVDSGSNLAEHCPHIKHIGFNFVVEKVEPPKTQKKEEATKSTETPIISTERSQDATSADDSSYLGCIIDGDYYRIGEQVRLKNCSVCKCGENGKVWCRTTDCNLSDECAGNCNKQCHYEGRTHDDGEAFWPSECVRCTCQNELINCEFHHPTSCPHLTCLEVNQHRSDNQCCPKCKAIDHCATNVPCHKFAECHNTETGPMCRCKEGFYGNGLECQDIDECRLSPDTQESIGGCSDGTVCVNTEGSYRCDCLPRYQRFDERHCLNLLLI